MTDPITRCPWCGDPCGVGTPACVWDWTELRSPDEQVTTKARVGTCWKDWRDPVPGDVLITSIVEADDH